MYRYIKSLLTLSVKSIIPDGFKLKVKSYFELDKIFNMQIGNNSFSIDSRSQNNTYGVIPVYYWDGLPNFGDLIGPYLLSKIANKPVLNIRSTSLSGIYTVGSIIQMLDRPNATIWGSGLIEEPNDIVKKRIIKNAPNILTVRGLKTAEKLEELGFFLPDKEAFGDPALLLPLFYKPEIDRKNNIGIIPHYSHKKLFSRNIEDQINIIDVQQDVEKVVKDIVSSAVCISTSLHGLIIAQAYGVPWVWLEICDNNLVGDEFKFLDFFSTIEEKEVVHVKVSESEIGGMDFFEISKLAKLPSSKYKSELILKKIKSYLTEKEYIV